VVLADAAPGLLDEHCAWRQEGALDPLVGIAAPPSERRALKGARTADPPAVSAVGRRWGLDAAALAGLEALEGDLQAKGGEALASLGRVPAVFARPSGKGWAVYLNVLLDRYPAARRKGYGGGAYRSLLASILAHLGVKPAVEVTAASGRPLGPARIARYRFGNADVVGVLLDPVDVDVVHGRDGVTIYDDSRLGRVARQEVEVRLPRMAEVVDARTGERFGRTDRVRTSVVVGEALVLALGEATPTLALAGPASAKRGEHARLSIVSPAAGRRLVRCHLRGPDGAFMPEYARNLLVDGAPGAFVVRFALDDPVGRYELRCADVTSGATAEGRLELR
jgi:hypothetical protein